MIGIQEDRLVKMISGLHVNMVFRSYCFQVAMNLSTVSSQACQVSVNFVLHVLLILLQPQSFPIQLSQLCTILGPLHNPGPMSRVMWDIFTDQAAHEGDHKHC